MLLHFEVERLELWKEGYGMMKAHTLGNPGTVSRDGTKGKSGENRRAAKVKSRVYKIAVKVSFDGSCVITNLFN